jgi:hypothetical protein
LGWNTGCQLVLNGTSDSFVVLDLEDPENQRDIEPFGTGDFDGTIFPWCANSSDIRNKAFLFFRNGIGAFFMFQRDASTIATTPFANVNPSFPGQALISGQSRVDVRIAADGTVSAVPFRPR